MSRITDLILDGKAFNRGQGNPMLDLRFGGQHGYAPDIKNFISNQAYVSRNLICILLEAPRFFRLMPNENIWTSTLKSMFELHAQSIDGFNAGLTVDTEEHPVGGGGEMQEEYTNVTRARSTPEFVFVEKYGLPIHTFLYNWITFGMMDPDTKYALSGTLEGETPTDLLADWYSASALFMEPDPTHKTVVKSWVSTNMFPKTTGDITGKRDLSEAGSVSTISVPFAAINHFSIGANSFAQSVLDNITLVNANPYLQPSPVDQVSPDVEAQEKGYSSSVDSTKV